MAAVIAYLFSIFLALLSTTWHLQSFTSLLDYSDLCLPLFLPLSPPQPPSLTSACIPLMGYCFSNLADRGTIFMYCFSIFISHAHIGPWSHTCSLPPSFWVSFTFPYGSFTKIRLYIYLFFSQRANESQEVRHYLLVERSFNQNKLGSRAMSEVRARAG